MSIRGSVPGVSHRMVDAGGLRMHVAEAGEGPLVILLHGFPESWYSWRHQLTALAAAGFRAVAPDQRGYGATGGPAEVAGYTMLHLTGDVMALLDALGEDTAVVAGHDWGAPVAWHAALFRPDRVRGVIGLSVPYRPRGSSPPVPVLRAVHGEGFYMVYFQQPGVADAELAADPPATFRRLLTAAAGSGTAGDWPAVVPARGGFLDLCPEPDALPPWLTAEDIEVFAAQFAESGFTGPLNWYRNLDRSWELTGAWTHAPILVPALYMAGEQDAVVDFLGVRGGLDRLRDVAPQLRDAVLLPGCGHWIQQERPDEVSKAMIEFIRGLD